MWIVALWLAAGCIEPSCPIGQVYSPVFGQCIGTEEPWTPTSPTPTGPTGDTSAPPLPTPTGTGDTASGG